MQVKRKDIATATIEQFADMHGLVMTVHERPLPVGDGARYYATFQHAEVKDGAFLVGTYGNGVSPEAAIACYADKISMTTLVIGAMADERREISVPRLIDQGAAQP